MKKEFEELTKIQKCTDACLDGDIEKQMEFIYNKLDSLTEQLHSLKSLVCSLTLLSLIELFIICIIIFRIIIMRSDK